MTALWLLLSVAQAGLGVSPAEAPPVIELFTRAGCPHCAAAKEFLATLAAELPALRVEEQRVDLDPRARARLAALAEAHGVVLSGLPVVRVGSELLSGFDTADTTGAQIRRLVTGASPAPEIAGAAACGVASVPCADNDVVRVPWLGELRPARLGLPLFTVVVGLLDGFNPCAMWVLLFLLSFLVNLHNRRRMLLLAGVFVLVSGAVYFAFMAAWLNVFLLLGLSRPVQVLLALVALVVGGLNVKEFVAFGVGPSLSIPAAAKPTIYARVRAILQAENLAGALLSVLGLAVLVNVVELLCTAGFPALYTHVLTARALPAWQNYAYLVLYNLAYVLDDSLMVGIAVLTLSKKRLQEREGRWLKLVSGAVMLALGLVLLLAPEWLERLG